MVKRTLIDLYKRFSGTVEFALRGLKYPANELIVLCMHSTPDDRMQQFSGQVDFLLKKFQPLKPSELDDYYSGKLNAGPYILFTFDDGLKNNLHAARVLEQKGISAFFFVVPDFISSSSQKEYYRKNIRRVIDPSVDKLDEDFTAMSYDDLRTLITHGHGIGAHSTTHTLSREMNEYEILQEVKGCKQILEDNLGVSVNAFCSINNTTLSVGVLCKSTIEEEYTFHFTTFPGLNGEEKNPLLIFRRNTEVHWPMGAIRFALGEWDLPRWRSAISRFQSLRP